MMRVILENSLNLSWAVNLSIILYDYYPVYEYELMIHNIQFRATLMLCLIPRKFERKCKGKKI